MGQNDHEKPDAGNGEEWLFGGIGIGAFLLQERKKKGLDYDQIYLMTRLRPTILEALESEDWEHLPAPVLVTGYIRSYARALGLEENRALALYQKVAALETKPLRALSEIPKTGKRLYLLVFLILPLLALAAAYYAWKEYPDTERVSRSPATLSSTGDDVSKPKRPQEPSRKPGPAVMNGQKEAVGDPEPVPEQAEPTMSAEEEGISASVAERRPVDSPSSPEAEVRKMLLKAMVRERTWVRISIDDNPSKEYILSPDTHHEWRAKQGFDLLIGNAGGIDLEFNGEKIENLGDPGQVVRMRLPKGYERSVQD